MTRSRLTLAKLTWTALVLLAAVVAPFAVVYLFLSFATSEPSTEALDADVRAVDAELAQVSVERAKYSGGAFLSLLEMRAQLLNTTRTMLEQKRSSLIRRIELQYTVNGKVYTPNPDRLAEIQTEIVSTNSDLEKDEAEAGEYSGGLLQSVALMNAETARLSISQLRRAYLFEKYGVPVPAGGPTALPMTNQNVVSDGDAL